MLDEILNSIDSDSNVQNQDKKVETEMFDFDPVFSENTEENSPENIYRNAFNGTEPEKEVPNSGGGGGGGGHSEKESYSDFNDSNVEDDFSEDEIVLPPKETAEMIVAILDFATVQSCKIISKDKKGTEYAMQANEKKYLIYLGEKMVARTKIKVSPEKAFLISACIYFALKSFIALQSRRQKSEAAKNSAKVNDISEKIIEQSNIQNSRENFQPDYNQNQTTKQTNFERVKSESAKNSVFDKYYNPLDRGNFSIDSNGFYTHDAKGDYIPAADRKEMPDEKVLNLIEQGYKGTMIKRILNLKKK